MPVLYSITLFALFRIRTVLLLGFLLCLIAEQTIQTMISEQETNWKLVISKLDTKVNTPCEMYDFCVDLLKNEGVPLSKGIN
jgi:hypothetical protein